MNPAEAAAAVILDEFLRVGGRDVVLAPGQRSAPLAVAAASAAADAYRRAAIEFGDRGPVQSE